MPSTPSKIVRRVLGEVAVNVGGTPSKAHLLNPSETDNMESFKKDNKKHELETTGCSIGKKRTFEEVDNGALMTETARPAFKNRLHPRNDHNMTLADTAMTGFEADNQLIVRASCHL